MTISNQPLGHEPSMEEILASIRRILKDDDQVSVPEGEADKPAATTSDEKPADEPVFVLGPSMMVPEAEPDEPTRSQEAGAIGATASLATDPVQDSEPVDLPEPAPAAARGRAGPSASAPEERDADQGSIEGPAPLIGASAADEAAQHLGSLIRTISANRAVAVSSSGPTLEEIVRNEMRPLLKAWLDANLPSLVERVVRSEIERLIR